MLLKHLWRTVPSQTGCVSRESASINTEKSEESIGNVECRARRLEELNGKAEDHDCDMTVRELLKQPYDECDHNVDGRRP